MSLLDYCWAAHPVHSLENIPPKRHGGVGKFFSPKSLSIIDKTFSGYMKASETKSVIFYVFLNFGIDHF